MPMLKRILDVGATLLDYELIKDGSGRRLIFFGRHAGYAGMLDALWALGQRLAREGHDTPFARLRPAWQYEALPQALDHVAAVGRSIAADGLPAALSPCVVGFTGTGNVSLGAQQVFDRLPFREVTPAELPALAGHADRYMLYKTVFDLSERYRRADGGPISLDELARHPAQFENGMLRFLPYVDVLVNGMFWLPTQPPILTLDALAAGRRDGTLLRLRVIADVACDINGAIQATVKATTPANPVFVYDVNRGGAVDGFDGNGPVVLAVDNLPAELPRESSKDFGDTLVPFVPALADCDWSRPLDALALPAELRRAVIAHRGALAPLHAWLAERLP
jgi:alpha-aminoadipic semialdehyde synthase